MAERDFEAHYRALFDYAPDGIVIADGSSYYLDANAAICRMLGYSRDELVGMHASDIVVPEEVEHIDPALTAIKSTANYNREWMFRRKDGTTFPADVMATVMPDGNLMAIVRDVTARKDAELAIRDREAQLRVAGRAARVGAWSVDLRTGRIKWSDELCEMRGVPAGTVPTRDEALATYAPEFRELIDEKAKSCATTGAPFDVELQILGTDNRKTWVRVIGQAERDTQGAIVQMHGAFQDIDERRRLEEQLRQARRWRRSAASRAASRTTSTTCSRSSSATPSCSSSDLQPRAIRCAATSSEIRGAGAARAAADAAAAGVQPPADARAAACSTSTQIVHGIEKMLRRLLGEDIELSLLIARALGKVLADPGQIEQVIMNLVVNARDAMPRGGKLTIETANVELDASYAGDHHGRRARART